MSKEKCFNHPDRNSISFCHVCKRHFCEACLMEGEEYYYCKNEDCSNEDRQKMMNDYKMNPRFCEKCIAETTDEDIGIVDSSYEMGKTIKDKRDQCPECGSYIVDKCGVFAGVTTKVYGSYRVIYLLEHEGMFSDSAEILSRRMK